MNKISELALSERCNQYCCNLAPPVVKQMKLFAVTILSSTIVTSTVAQTKPPSKLIKCPLKNESRYYDITLLNGTARYCGVTKIRQCRDASGCVGKKYSNATTLYEDCGLYTSPNVTGRNVFNPYIPILPIKIRIDADSAGLYKTEDGDTSAAYLEFVCNRVGAGAGHEPPITVEYWPPKPPPPTTYPVPPTVWSPRITTYVSPYPGDWYCNAPPYEPYAPYRSDCMVSVDAPDCRGASSNFCRDATGNQFCCNGCAANDGFVWNVTVTNACSTETEIKTVKKKPENRDDHDERAYQFEERISGCHCLLVVHLFSKRSRSLPLSLSLSLSLSLPLPRSDCNLHLQRVSPDLYPQTKRSAFSIAPDARAVRDPLRTATRRDPRYRAG